MLILTVALVAAVAIQKPDSTEIRQRLIAAIRDTSDSAAGERFSLSYRAADAGLNVPALVAPFMRDPNPQIRANAVGFLDVDLMADSPPFVDSAVVLLQAAMRDESPLVRGEAVDQLARCEAFRRGSAAPALIAALADSEARVRRGAVYALGQFDSAAIPAVPALIRMTTADPEWEVRWLSTRVLGWLGPIAREAVPTLLTLAQSSNDSLRLEAISSLGSVSRTPPGDPNPLVIATLERGLRDPDPEIRRAAVQGLMHQGSQSARRATAALADRDSAVALAAAALLGQGHADTVVITALVKALGHRNEAVRQEAADALGSLGEASRPQLTAAERSRNPHVRNGAQRGLNYLERVRRSAVAGRCYALHRGTWSPTLSIGRDSVFSRFPETVRFNTKKALFGWGDTATMIVEPANASPMSVHGPGSWSTVTGSEVDIVWSTGFSGVTAHLETGDDGATLKGEAETFWDFPREQQKAPVTGERVACNP